MKSLQYLIVAILFVDSSISFNNRKIVVLKHNGVVKHYSDREDQFGSYFTADTLHEKSKVMHMCSAIIKSDIFVSAKDMDEKVVPQVVFEGFKIPDDFIELNGSTHIYSTPVKIRDPETSNIILLMVVNCGLEGNHGERNYYILYGKNSHELAYFLWKPNEDEFHNMALIIIAGNADVNLIYKAWDFINYRENFTNEYEQHFKDLEDRLIFSSMYSHGDESICHFGDLKKLAICASIHSILYQKDKTNPSVENLVYHHHVCRENVPLKRFSTILQYTIDGVYNETNDFDEGSTIAVVDMIGCKINNLYNPDIYIALDHIEDRAGFLIIELEETYKFVTGHVEEVIALERSF